MEPTIKSVLIEDGGHNGSSRWRCTITTEHGTAQTEYTMGAAYRKKSRVFPYASKPTPPDVVGVLYSLVSDAECGSETFEDFCANFGYDTDSRKALETYLACQESGAKLRKLGGETYVRTFIPEDY